MKRLTVLLIGAMFLAGCASAPRQDREPEAFPMPVVQTPEREANGAIYQTGRDRRLFENRTALRPGDILTIVLEEETGASKQASTTISKSSDVNIGAPQMFGRDITVGGNPLSASSNADRGFDGSGGVDQQNQLSGTLTAIVTEVHPSGNLVIQGRKKLTINHGDEYLTITGLVRPDDVRPDNTVSSTRVANAQIAYTGTGTLAESNQMGWLSRLFNSRLWPF
ncbi:MAG: flagellar basal body L-ring protein FlgH [Ectothiorhodospiraceae bacterium]|nr:flagellar basal body L-ring protein FlgH [Ectothiorhodospiraceae bacterium]